MNIIQFYSKKAHQNRYTIVQLFPKWGPRAECWGSTIVQPNIGGPWTFQEKGQGPIIANWTKLSKHRRKGPREKVWEPLLQ